MRARPARADPVVARAAAAPDASLADVRRRLDLVVLVHLWALAPLALAWFLIPSGRDPTFAVDARLAGGLAAGAVLYLAIRTGVTLRAATSYAQLWPFIDVAIISLALGLLRNPTDVLALLYFIPMASAVASLRPARVMGLAAFATVGYLATFLISRTPWTIGVVSRVAMIGVMASVYGSMIRIVTAELRDVNRRLADASRHKSAFLANMSHELRTPLNAILGYVELVLDDIYEEVPEKIRGVLERVRHNGRHLLALINDVLDLSKIEAGQITLVLEGYSLGEVVHSVAAAVEPLAADKNLALHVGVPADLPRGRGDPRRVTQVVMNLVGNAVKFTDAGEVRIDVACDGREFLVTVSDTGPGIAEADRALIFEEFQQADTSSTRSKGGTGLGLTIARRIVEMHGGRIWVESMPGVGSTFRFNLPVRVERQVERPRRARA